MQMAKFKGIVGDLSVNRRGFSQNSSCWEKAASERALGRIDYSVNGVNACSQRTTGTRYEGKRAKKKASTRLAK